MLRYACNTAFFEHRQYDLNELSQNSFITCLHIPHGGHSIIYIFFLQSRQQKVIIISVSLEVAVAVHMHFHNNYFL